MGGEKRENQTIKKQRLKHIPFTFENDDTPKQLLARSRYIIAKPNDWTQNQRIRANYYSQIIFYIKHISIL
jgi:hypothetical protein